MPEQSDSTGGSLAPPVVYVPVTLDEGGEVEDIRMIQLQDGRIALVAYTALDRLVDGCGEHQPWLLVDASKLRPGPEQPWDVRYLDVDLPTELRVEADAS